MKKTMMTRINSLVALMILGTAFVACSSDSDSIIENQQPANPTGKYTMTINATKSDGAITRALSLDETVTPHQLKATWNAGEEVLVYQDGSQIGTLTAAASATASTTLSGTLDSAPADDKDLTFYFHTAESPSYSGQDGTLAKIASTYDYCNAATVTTGNFTVNANHTVSVSGGISFGANQQAIIKFILLAKGEPDVAISPSALTVTDGTRTVSLTSIPDATYTANGAGVLYVAFPATGSAETITLTATVGTDTYTYVKSGVTFTNGKYYEIQVKMTKPTDLSTISADYEAKNGETLTGTLTKDVKISIADGATVKLDNVNITNLGDNCDWAGINCLGNATLVLEGTNEVCAGRDVGEYNSYPGIYIASGKTLTIQGAGTLTAYSNDTNPYGAGIGGGYEIACGNIVINGGIITATGGENSAGIGGGKSADCGNITISGGTVSATGGDYAAGIGGVQSGSCGYIAISGGTVEATGGNHAAGIGGGYQNKACGNITISSGVTSVTATKGSGANSIGAGSSGIAITVTIDGVANATTSSTFTNFNSSVSGNTWTLTHK